MSIYEKTPTKLQYLTNKNLENETELSRLDTKSPKVTSIYYNKNTSKYYIFNKQKLFDIKNLTSLIINLYNFPEEYLLYINFVGFIYANHNEWIPAFYFYGLNYSFFQIADKHYKLKFPDCYFSCAYTAYFTLYFTLTIPGEYSA